jgi:type I restriction enzyme S subunit
MADSPEDWTRAQVSDLADANPEQLGSSTPRDFRLMYLDIGSILETGRLGSFSEHLFADAPSRARRRVRSGDVVVSTVRPYLRAFAHVVDPPLNLVASTGFTVLRSKDERDGAFLYQQILSPTFVDYLKGRMKGGSYPAVTADDVSSFEFLLPGPKERRKIAAILSSIDDAIERTGTVIEQVQVLKKAMMQDLLTRGIPGKHQTFKITEIGEIPEEWDIVKLGAMVEVDTGYAFRSQDFVDEGPYTVPIVRMSNLREGILNLSEAKHVRREVVRGLDKFSLVEGDFLVGLSGSLSAYAWVGHENLPCFLNQRVGRFRGEKGMALFLTRWYLSDFVQNAIKRLSAGNAQANVSPGEIRSLPMPLPPGDERELIIETLMGIEDRARCEMAARAKLSELKTSLMSVLLSGEVRVTPDEVTR